MLRYGEFDLLRKQIEEKEGGLAKFTQAFRSFGIHCNPDNSVSCKEWAPGAKQLYLYGDFSKCLIIHYARVILTFILLKLDGWDKRKNPYKKLDFGKWELNLPANSDGTCPIKHGSKVKVGLLHTTDSIFKSSI